MYVRVREREEMCDTDGDDVLKSGQRVVSYINMYVYSLANKHNQNERECVYVIEECIGMEISTQYLHSICVRQRPTLCLPRPSRRSTGPHTDAPALSHSPSSRLPHTYMSGVTTAIRII